MKDLERASTTDGLPVAPSMGPTLAGAQLPPSRASVDVRVLVLCGLAIALALAAGLVAQGLTALIALVTNFSYYGRFSTVGASPAQNSLGGAAVVVPIVGGLIVGLMARYGSKAIRGHGIPEAMEQVLTNQSRVPVRMMFLKPLSAAIAIGTGGPFGAEGPIIATGGALGSVVGQLLHTTSDERKTLLAAGAAAGMAATFGSPVAAVLLAIELLLFEYRARSLVPVAFAAATANGVRFAFAGSRPAFAMHEVAAPTGSALAAYIVIGALVGVAAVIVTRGVYAVEDAFEKLPIHWMWWPALGGIAVGVVGLIAPRTLGVGYDNLDDMLLGTLAGRALFALAAWKLASWIIALGSGTSGGTLAPLFTVGGGVGAALATAAAALLPSSAVDVQIGALVGMAAMFAGASRALLASVVFAFETTRQPLGLLPLLGGCSAAYLVSLFGMRHSIMTEKIARRGVRVVAEYTADFLERLHAGECATREVIALSAGETVAEVRARLASTHQGYPILDADRRLVGVLTRRDLWDPSISVTARLGELVRRAPVVVLEDSSLREAADQMARERVGRLPVVAKDDPRRVVGILSRSDLVAALSGRLAETQRKERAIKI